MARVCVCADGDHRLTFSLQNLPIIGMSKHLSMPSASKTQCKSDLKQRLWGDEYDF